MPFFQYFLQRYKYILKPPNLFAAYLYQRCQRTQFIERLALYLQTKTDGRWNKKFAEYLGDSE